MMRITFCLLIVLYVSNIVAQTDTLWMEEIEVSAYRAPTLYSESSRVISIITKDEISNAPVQSIQEILEYALNVDIRQRGVGGVQSDVSIRGGSFDQALILLNGVQFNDPQTGHHNLDLPVDIENIERIEILEGPGSRIFGPNAFSGAINIITGTSDTNNAKISLLAGENSLYGVSFSISNKIGRIKNYLSVSKKSTDGYINNTDFGIFNVYYRSAYKIKNGKFIFQAGWIDKEFGANDFYTPKYPDQFENTKTTFFDLKFEGGKKVKISPNIYWKRHKDKFELFREGKNWYKKEGDVFVMNGDTAGFPTPVGLYPYKGHNYHMTDVYGGGISVSFNSSFGRTAFGSTFRSENILSNVLGETMEHTKPVKGEADGVFTKSKSRENLSFFAEHNIYFGRITISAGMLLNWNSDYDWKIYPGIDMSYKLNDIFKIFGSVNNSLRMPTFTDLYYQGPTNIGNPNLKPEEATSFEVGLKISNDFMTGNLSLFRRNGKNIIDWVKLNDTLKWESRNITNLHTNGLEIAMQFSLKNMFNKKTPIEYLRVSYAYLDMEKNSKDYISKYALDYLKNKFVVGIQHKIYKNIGASWQYIYQDRAEKYFDFEKAEETEYDPFSLLDVRVFWKRKNLNVYFEATNLFDKKYFDFGNIEMPGRWIRAGVVLRFEYL
jgi:vitamin B12 transporter